MSHVSRKPPTAAARVHARFSLAKAVFAIGLFAGPAAIAGAAPAAAQTVLEVWPGETVVFATATDGAAACRIGDTSNPCGAFRRTNAEATPSANEVFARVSELEIPQPPFPPGGEPFVAAATVSNDFQIPGPPDGLVDVQISVRYDFTANFSAAGLYTLESALQLRIEDRDRNRIVAVQPLARLDREGDQGVELGIGAAHEKSVLLDEVAHFPVKLRRGGLYRLHFEVQSSAVTFAVGAMEARGTARFHWMSVSVDEDEAELLAGHDFAVRTELALLKADHAEIKADLAEIKGKLDGIRDDLAEIRTLLLTPQGRRPGFPEEGAAPPPGQQSKAPESAPPPGRRSIRGGRKL